jgi:uncharacterized membrane protein
VKGDAADRGAYERELQRLSRGSLRRYAHLRAEVARAVRRGEAVRDPIAAPLAVAAARLVQVQPTWPWLVIVAAIGLAVLAVMMGGFALIWYVATVVPALIAEPFRVRRRRDRALSAELANLALAQDD